MRQFDDNIPSRAFDNFQVNCVVILWNYGAAYLDQTWEILTLLVQCSLWTSHRSCQDLYPQAKRRQNLLFQHWWRSQNSSRQQWVFSFLGIFLVKTTPISGTFGSSFFLFPCSTHPIDLYLVSWAANEGDFQTDQCCLRLWTIANNTLDVQQSNMPNLLATEQHRKPHRCLKPHQRLDRTAI